MSIVLKPEGNKNKLILRGDLTIKQGKYLKDTFQSAGERDLVVDMEQTSSLDTCCLQQILAFSHALEKVGKRLSISGMSEAVREVFSLSGLTDYLSCQKE